MNFYDINFPHFYRNAAYIENSPVNNHYPSDPLRRAYPDLGRQLRQDDVGKQILRVYPHKSNEGYFDWSYMPLNSKNIDSARMEAILLVSLNNNVIMFEDGMTSGPHKLKWTDRHWLTLEEWLAYLKDSKETSTASNETSSFPDGTDFSEPPALKEEYLEKINSLIQKLLQEIEKREVAQKPTPSFSHQKKTNFEESFLDEIWYKTAQEKLPSNFTPVDYSYHRPERLSKASDAYEERPFDLKAQEPRAILGLGPDVKDVALIKKHYHKLALKFHPDKNPQSKISEEEFKKITGAYKTLLKNIEGSSFSTANTPEGDDEYAMASYCYSNLLKEMENDKSEPGEILKKWRVLVDETKKSCKKHFDSPQIKLLFERMLLQANSFLHLLEIKSRLDELHFPEKSSSSEDTANTLLDKMQQVNALIQEFDLNNQRTDLNNVSWPMETFSNCFETANYLVLDKYIAFARSAAEIYIKLNQPERAMELRQKIQQFIVNRTDGLLGGHLAANINQMEFLTQLHSFEPFNKTPDEQKNNASVPEQNEPVAEESKKHTETKESAGKELEFVPEAFDEQEAIIKNFNKNKLFFIKI